MEKETAEDIRSMLQMSVDAPRRYRLAEFTRNLLAIQTQDTNDVDSIMEYNQAVASSLAARGSSWPHYEAYRPALKEAVRLNHLQNNLRILTAQTRAIDVVPQWINTQDDITSTARTEWWKWRSQGMDGLGGWKTDLDNAFVDFAALGEGYLRTGVTEANSGKNVMTVVHYHPLNVMLDPYAKYVNESRWCCFSTVMSEEECEERFPDFDYEEHAAQYQRLGVQLQGVRIIEYYAKPSKDDAVTYMALAGSLGGEIIESGKNPFDDIPVQAFLGFMPSGSDIPIGMVASCIYAQRELDTMDTDAKKKSARDNLLGLPSTMFNQDDLKSYADGNRPEIMRLDEDYMNMHPEPQKQIVTVPRNGENDDQKARREEYLAMMQQLSGVSTLDMGQISGNDATATEVNQVAARGQQQISFYSREFSRGIQELAPKLGRGAKRFDTDDFCVNFDGTPVWFNAKDKRLSSKTLFTGALNCVIGDEDLIMTDVNSKRLKEGQKWLTIYQISQAPEAWRQYLLSQGIKNPEDFVPPPPPMPMGAQPPQGQPMPMSA